MKRQDKEGEVHEGGGVDKGGGEGGERVVDEGDGVLKEAGVVRGGVAAAADLEAHMIQQ